MRLRGPGRRQSPGHTVDGRSPRVRRLRRLVAAVHLAIVTMVPAGWVVADGAAAATTRTAAAAAVATEGAAEESS